MNAAQGGVTSIQGGTAANMIPDFASCQLVDGTSHSAQGKSAHGSTPEHGENAIAKLCQGRECTEHQPNEYIETADFFQCKDIYKQAILNCLDM